MILVTQDNNDYEVRFSYDLELVQLIKNVPGRVWVPEGKFWRIPKARLGFLINQLAGTPYESQLKIQSNEQINVNAEIESTRTIPNVDISDVDWYIKDGCQTFKHQMDTVRYDKWRNEHGWKTGFILADSPGLGKTVSVLDTAMYHKKKYGSKHCLVIACVNSAKYNWREDIIKNSNGTITPYILGTRFRKDKVSLRCDTGSKEKIEDLMNMTMYGDKKGEPLPYFLILNIEALRAKIGKTYIITSRLIELANAGEIGVIALDEIHKNCLAYNTLVQTEEGFQKIGDIVENKKSTRILSYDEDTRSTIYMPVTEWHRNQSPPMLLELTFEENGKIETIQCTQDHKFYTRNRGWTRASDLEQSDDVVFNPEGVQ